MISRLMQCSLRKLWLALLLLLTFGCAGPIAGLGQDEADAAIESAAADESFPDAAEAGITPSKI